jgi:hypothetical protein
MRLATWSVAAVVRRCGLLPVCEGATSAFGLQPPPVAIILHVVASLV